MRSVLVSLALVAASAAALAQTLVDGEVRKVDAAQKKITLKHGEIPNLDMPPMSMVFEVQDAALLGPLKPGDKVRFAAEKQNGKYTVTAIEAAK